MSWEIRQGDCIEAMRELDESSIDAVVCDPPYGLGFMGTAWDTIDGRTTGTQRRDSSVRYDHVGGNHNPVDAADAARTRRVENQKAQEWHYAWATEALRVLKPGGHLLAAGGSRTFHRLVSALEDAGFEIRDCITHLYGSGFPKSLDVSKAIDKAAGAEREVIGKTGRCTGPSQAGEGGIGTFKETNWEQSNNLTAPATPEAEQWQGWGTALKPAAEFWTLARKPLVGTVARNVQEHGTGALNVDGCRVEAQGRPLIESHAEPSENAYGDGLNGSAKAGTTDQGRWPANVVLDEESARLLDEQSGELTSGRLDRAGITAENKTYGTAPKVREGIYEQDSGGASRFFYCAKSSRAERNAGLEGFEAKAGGSLAVSQSGDTRVGRMRSDGAVQHQATPMPSANGHPTVKPITLMRWLCRLVTPPGGLILDPFAGSGTTGVAAVLEGFDFLGIEQSEEYCAIARARIAHWAAQPVQLGLEAA